MAESKEVTAKQWMGVREVADYLGLKPSTIYQMVSERRIPHNKIPGSQVVKFRVSEIEAWMEKGRRETREQHFKRLHRKKGGDHGNASAQA